MRIAQVCPNYYPSIGGVQTHVREISVRLALRQFDVEIITTDPSRKLKRMEVIDGITVRRFDSWAPNKAYYFSPRLEDYLMKNAQSYDVVHAHNYHGFPALYAAEAKKTNKLIFTPRYHGGGHTLFRNLLHLPYRLLGKKIFDRSDKIISLSKYERRLLFSRFNLQEDRVVLIPNGITKGEFSNLKRKRDQKILCVSRLEKYKGVDYLIKVLPKLDENLSLEIIGEGPHGRSLVKLMEGLRLETRIKFSSNLSREELLRRYGEADVFALLSKYEAFGNTVAEALASGTPCVVANTSALSDWIDNKNCYGVNYPIDLDSLARLINQVINDHREKPASVELLDWDDVAKKVAETYVA